MSRALGSKHKKQIVEKPTPYCPACGNWVHPHFTHHCYKVTDLEAGKWNARGRGAFQVIAYVE
jgi:hypothetical protein